MNPHKRYDKDKKGIIELNMLPGILISLVISVIVLSVMGTLTQKVINVKPIPLNATVTYTNATNQIPIATTIFYNVSTKGGEGVFQTANFMPIVGLVVIASIVIGILFMLRR